MAEKSKLDYSEYQASEYEKYCARLRSDQTIRFEFFTNKVAFHNESRTMRISVDDSHESYTMQDLIDEFKRIEAEHSDEISSGSEQLADDEEDECDDDVDSQDDFEQNKRDIQLLKSRYEIDTSQADDFFARFREVFTDEQIEPMNNVLSGGVVSLNLGEGILDFIYADFDSPFKEALKGQYILQQVEDILLSKAERSEQELGLDGEYSEKIYNQNCAIVQEYFGYVHSLSIIRKIMYSSLYSAVCPPAIKDSFSRLKPLKRYYGYIKYLQKLYLEMIEFCFDEDFYPEVLGFIPAHERHVLFQKLHDFPTVSSRTEKYSVSHHVMSGDRMPYGMTREELLLRVNSEISHGAQLSEFCKKYSVSPDEMDVRMRFPYFISIDYTFSTIEDILVLEFTKMLEYGVRFRKCKRCGKYFIMKGNYDTNYCDRIAPGETKNCQEIAAQENYRAKVAANPALPIYNRYYKRYSARVKSRQIKEADFKAWKYQALTKRDECTDGIITPEEYIEWMESCFPNRSHNTTA